MRIRQKAYAAVAAQLPSGDRFADDIPQSRPEDDVGQVVIAFVDAAPADESPENIRRDSGSGTIVVLNNRRNGEMSRITGSLCWSSDM